MKGLELSRAYYQTYGDPMLREQFPELLPEIAVGLLGSGSECFGYDDEISRDHDFEPGFCIFLPEEDRVDRKTAFQLERAYAKLPGEFMGVKKLMIQPVGGNRHGVLNLNEFLIDHLGAARAPERWQEWLSVPENNLAEITNGEIFYDGPGTLTALRKELAYYPEDIRKKKLAGALIMMAQAGSYNYPRCLEHREGGAAQLALGEYARYAMEAAFALNRRYMPYYKWSFRALRELSILSGLAESLEFLLTSDNSEDMASVKTDMLEDLNGMILEEVRNQGLTRMLCTDPEKHAYSVNDGIEESSLRTAGIFAAV